MVRRAVLVGLLSTDADGCGSGGSLGMGRVACGDVVKGIVILVPVAVVRCELTTGDWGPLVPFRRGLINIDIVLCRSTSMG